ncbi:MAG: magnesium transporter [Candidatus Aenigmatarchaeota archaeon]
MTNKSNKRFAIHYVTNKVPIVTSESTISDVKKLIKNKINEFVSLNYIYVVDKGKLVGVFSIKKLYTHDPKTKVDSLCKGKDTIKVKSKDTAVLSAYLSLKNNISMIPVVDDDGTFFGVITYDKILLILHERHMENRFSHVGISKNHLAFDDTLKMPILQAVRFRILWLIIGLFGGFLAAGVISSFEKILSQNIILAAFIPLVVYTASAVGMQMEVFTIRDITFHSKLVFSKYFLKQFSVVILIGLILGLISALLCLAIFGSIKIAIVVGISIIVASGFSVLSGLLIPFMFRKIKKDPAVGSGPIGTIIQDIISVTIFFLIASLL